MLNTRLNETQSTRFPNGPSQVNSTTRRGFITSALCLIAAPAIVRASSLMPVRAWLDDGIALRSITHPVWPSDAELVEAMIREFTEGIPRALAASYQASRQLIAYDRVEYRL